MDTNKTISTPLVTVVMPVYNTDAYLMASVKSILSQTLKEIEVIIINDGSTDESPAILEALAKEDERITLIHQENRGQSAGRNVGIGHSSAPYIYFMDSDDLLEPDALRRCYERCTAENLDFVTFDAEPFADCKRFVLPMKYDRSKCLTETEVYSGDDAMSMQLEKQCFTPSPCLYMVRREFLNEHNVRFHEGIIHEDELFTPLIYLNAKRMGYIQEKFYHRRFRCNSTMTNKFSWRNVNGYLTVSAELEAIRPTLNEKCNQILDCFLSKMLNVVVWKASPLPLCSRTKLLQICIANGYTRYISKRSLAIMMFKKYAM